MGESIRRLIQAIRFEREAFVWMDFSDRATGDAVIFIAVTQVLLIIGSSGSVLGPLQRGGVIGLAYEFLQALIFWLVFAGITYLASRHLFRGDASYAAVMRIAGFAYPTLLMLLAADIVFNFPLSFILGSVWFLAVVANGVRYVADLPVPNAWLSAVLGIAGWLIVAAIFF